MHESYQLQAHRSWGYTGTPDKGTGCGILGEARGRERAGGKLVDAASGQAALRVRGAGAAHEPPASAEVSAIPPSSIDLASAFFSSLENWLPPIDILRSPGSSVGLKPSAESLLFCR